MSHTHDPSPRPRCSWADTHPLYVAYHDEEWGQPLHDERRLFEMLILEGAQAGLSWLTILKRREGYRRAFEGFDPERIARWGEAEQARLLADPGIIRNRAKVAAAIGNAQAYLKLRDEWGGLDPYLWSFTKGRQLRTWPRARDFRELPTESPESRAMSRDMKRRGFRFVGPTILYAHMQACGMVDDHLEGCFRAQEADA